jgi:hypothetical protein
LNVQTSSSRETGRASDEGIERDVLAPILRRSMLWTPERQAWSHWVEHVPFAFWLVDVLRPRTIVELGTYNGVSYSAMCQAVKSLQLPTSCFAVDTWRGEEYMGFYSEDVYCDFAAFHDERYSAFSQLVRSSFDEALSHFEDGSIDLLHIDGVHTYDAVRHDYQSWLPKLSRNAIVLFHDTNVREREFGIFRLWTEITPKMLHFTFLHGYGLGILGQGRDYSGALSTLFRANEDGRVVYAIREIFGALGRSVRASTERRGLEQLLSKRTSEIGGLRQALGASEDDITVVKQGLAESASEISSLRQLLAAREDGVAALKQGLADGASEISSLQQLLSARDDELTVVKQRLAERISEIDALREALAARDAKISLSDATMSALRASTSWRTTAPLRAARRLAGRFCYSNLGYPLVLAWRSVRTRSLSPLRDWRAECVIAYSRLFDVDWYLKNNPDVSARRINPVRHYVAFGAKEGRDPSPRFSTRAYLWHNPDVAAAEVNPLAHFVLYGAFEGRLPGPSTPPNSPANSHQLSEPVCLEIKHGLGFLGPKISAYLSGVLATTRYRRNLGQVVKSGENFLDLYKAAYLIHAQRALAGHSPHYGARIGKSPPTDRCDVQLIAYYLPQYHPIPENDRWWGPGFTEWRNVARAFPVFAGHNQPRVPAELGYYDLRIPEVMHQQIALAKLHGISAFCFHFYWFGGKRLLELPIENFLRNSDLDFKFCLCWANENWTRRWDGADQDILVAQSHSAEDDVAFIRYLTKYFNDPRYLRIHGKPVLTV